MQFVRIYLEVMSAHAPMDLMVILMSNVSYAIVPNVNVNHLTHLLVIIAFWPAAPINKHVQKELNVSQLPAAFLTVHVPKDSKHKMMERVLTLMNVWRSNKHVDLMRFVQTLLVDLHAHAPMDTMVMLILVCAHQRNEDVLPTKSVVQTSNAFNRVNVFAHLPSSSMLEMFVEIHVRDLAAALMPNVHRQIVSVNTT
jgi:hypothetical protein